MLVTSKTDSVLRPQDSLPDGQIDACLCRGLASSPAQPEERLLHLSFLFFLPETSRRFRDAPPWWRDARWGCDEETCPGPWMETPQGSAVGAPQSGDFSLVPDVSPAEKPAL